MKGNSKTKSALAYQAPLIILIAALLAGCGGATPTLEPTIDIQPTLALVQTQAAQTVVAEMTQNAPTAAPPLPTDTPVPTEPPPTDTPEPTATVAFVLPTSTNTVIPATSTPASTATLSNLNCVINEQSVSFGDDFPPNADFDGRWVVENTGTQTWSASAVDVKYLSGTKFQTKIDAFDLPADVAPDGTVTIIVDMKAPDANGRYSTTWGIVQGSTVICSLSITLDVR